MKIAPSSAHGCGSDWTIWLAEVESAFNPYARSPAGATGLYQFMPATAERFGLSTQPEDQRLDPEFSAAPGVLRLEGFPWMYCIYKRTISLA